MAMAISCSPMMTVVAPSDLRWAVSSSECERAMIGSVGLIFLACITICPPSNASGMATIRCSAPGEVGRLDHLGGGGVAVDHLEPRRARLGDERAVFLDQQHAAGRAP